MSDHPFRSFSGRNFGHNAMQSANYKGYEILETPHIGTFNHYESHGIKVDKAYTVVDEFGDQTLPLIHNVFWTPADAAQAIDAAIWFEARVNKSRATWPSTIVFEYNTMMSYRRNFFAVFQALKEIEDLCVESKDLDENPRDAIIERLQLLRLEVQR